MEKINNIVIHCSDSTWGSGAEIRRWHLAKGWRDGGYHFVINNGHVKPDLFLETLDGNIEVLRELDGDSFIEDNEIGAHALGYNQSSIGICLIGKDAFSARQFSSLTQIVNEMRKRWEIAIPRIIGHCESRPAGGKTCPNFNVGDIRRLLRKTY